MQKCINCGHDNRSGVMFCENCGVGLAGQLPVQTKSVDASSDDEKAQLGIDESVLIDVHVQGAAVFAEQDFLRLEVEGSPDPLVFKPSAETIFGRRDPATGAMPDVDLTPFAGYRMGVSRRHAAIRFGDGQSLNVWDLGSSNGTYLNGERLNAHRPYRLHDGDELRLGQMLIRIRFQAAPDGAEQADAEGTNPESAAQSQAGAPGAADNVEAPSVQSAPVTDEFVIPSHHGAQVQGDLPTTNPVEPEGGSFVEVKAPNHETAPPEKPTDTSLSDAPPPPNEKRD